MSAYDIYKKEVLDSSLWLLEHGFFGSARGTGGNVSVRVPGEPVMVITPSSVRYQDLNPTDMCVLGLDLKPLEGVRKPSMESGMHAIIYENRPDVCAVVHTHQDFGSVCAVINEPVPAMFDEVAFSLGHVVEVVPYALSGSAELAENVASKLSNNANAYLIQNHGVLALGPDLERALLNAELLEKASRVYCLALSTGRPVCTLPAGFIDTVKAMRDHEVNRAREKISGKVPK